MCLTKYVTDFPTVFFNSNDVSKPNASSFLTQVRDSELVFPLISPDLSKLRTLAEKIQERFGLDLLGIDVIIENRTGHYAIIDINTFPGFEDVPDFLRVLFNLIRQKLGLVVENNKTVISSLISDRHDETNHH